MPPLTIAITGINATHNPGPGVAVARALRAHPEFDGRIIGLAYDTLDPGIYARDIIDDVYLIPYPSQGKGTLEKRLRYIAERSGIDVLLPTLDSELPSFIALEPVLDELGIGHFMPTLEQLELRSKQHLAELGARTNMPVPETRAINDVNELFDGDPIEYPVFVKGVFYGAKRARNVHEAVAAFHHIVAEWGVPVLIQAETKGVEIDIVGLGDGAGGLIGAVAMRKLVLTNEGKGWAGVAIRDPHALEMTQRFTEASSWRGPFELEVMKDEDSGEMQVLEINPRFPAWCYLSAGAGANLPYACALLAADQPLDRSDYTNYTAGTMFVRIALDQIVSLDEFQRVASAGELVAMSDEETSDG
jgi:carbamoyl-phosphate synthase large subunit